MKSSKPKLRSPGRRKRPPETEALEIDDFRPKSLARLFFETRVFSFGLNQEEFAREVLGGVASGTLLGLIETGRRLPNVETVRRLGAARRESPESLLSILVEERIERAFEREIRNALHLLPGDRRGDESAVIALAERAISALPDDSDTAVSLEKWRRSYREDDSRPTSDPPTTLESQVERYLEQKRLVVIFGSEGERFIKKKHSHLVPTEDPLRVSLASSLHQILTQAVVEKLLDSDQKDVAYLKYHYFHIEAARIPEFQGALFEMLEALRKQFSNPESATTVFERVVVAATAATGRRAVPTNSRMPRERSGKRGRSRRG